MLLSLKHYHTCFAGALLLEEVVNSCGTEGICAIIDAAKRCFSESQREKDVGSAIWWRVSRNHFVYIVCFNSSLWTPFSILDGTCYQIREATLFALSSLSDQLLEAEVCASLFILMSLFWRWFLCSDKAPMSLVQLLCELFNSLF